MLTEEVHLLDLLPLSCSSSRGRNLICSNRCRSGRSGNLSKFMYWSCKILRTWRAKLRTNQQFCRICPSHRSVRPRGLLFPRSRCETQYLANRTFHLPPSYRQSLLVSTYWLGSPRSSLLGGFPGKHVPTSSRHAARLPCPSHLHATHWLSLFHGHLRPSSAFSDRQWQESAGSWCFSPPHAGSGCDWEHDWRGSEQQKEQHVPGVSYSCFFNDFGDRAYVHLVQHRRGSAKDVRLSSAGWDGFWIDGVNCFG